MTRVALVCAAGWGNVGDDIIAARIIRREEAAGNTVTLIGGSIPIPGVEVRRVARTGSLLSKIQVAVQVARSGRLVVGGGGLFDDRNPTFYRPYTRAIRTARMLRRPYDIVGVGVGAIRHEQSGGHYRYAFAHARSAEVRDQESADRIASTGAPTPAIGLDPALWTDTAFPPANSGYDLLVNLRYWPFEDTLQGGVPFSDDMIDLIADHLNLTHTGSIGLVSMSTLTGDDDSTTLRKLAKRLNHDIVGEHYSGSIAEVEGLVQSSRSILTMRLHLALLGVRHGTPVAAIAYDSKLTQQGRTHGFATTPLDVAFGSDSISNLLRVLRDVRSALP